MMHVTWFVPSVRKWPWQRWYNYDKVLASTWIRCLQLIPYLSKLGIKSKINEWDNKTQIAVFLRRWNEQDQAIAAQLKQKYVKIILDTPVNYFSSQNLPAFEGKIRDHFMSFAELADAILCPSSYIEQYGRKLGYSVLCLEDSVDVKHFCYRRKNNIRNDKPVLIWSGVSVKAESLNFLATSITRNNWPIIIISDKKPRLEFDFTFIKWRYKSFPRNILKGDIGIFPRFVDNEYDMGHSFFKIGVFLAQGLPVLCSPVVSYKQLINESNGMVVSELDALRWERDIKKAMMKLDVFDFKENPVMEYSSERVALRYQKEFSEILSEQ